MADDIETRQAKRRADVATSHAGKVVWCCSSNAEECFNDCEELFRTVASLRADLRAALAVLQELVDYDNGGSGDGGAILGAAEKILASHKENTDG